MTYRVLILSGGGATGEFQRGALSVLKGCIPKVDYFCGIGVGSLNSVVLAQHDSLAAGIDEVEQVWTNIRGNSDLFETPFLGSGLAALGALIGEDSWVSNAVYTTKATKRLIQQHVSWERLKDRNNWAVGITSLTDACFYPVTNDQRLLNHFYDTHRRRVHLSLDPQSKFPIGSNIHDLILAAASVPVFFPPVSLFGHEFCEGGLRDYSPVPLGVTAYQLALKAQPDLDAEFIVINNEPASETVIPKSKIDSGREILVRMIRIMSREMIDNDVAMGKARIRETPGANVKWRILAPQKDLELQPLDFDNRKKRNELHKHGIEVASAMFGK